MFVERYVLETIHHHPCLRPLIDTTEDPSTLVLRYLDDNLLEVSGKKRLAASDLKFVARSTLEALAELHGKGFVHTGNNAYLKSLKILILTIEMEQTSSLTISSSIMAKVPLGSAKYSWVTLLLHIIPIQTQTLFIDVTQSVHQYSEALKQC